MMGRTRHRSPGLTAFPGALAVHPSTVRTRRMGAGAMRKIGRSRRELSPLICCLPDRPRRIEPGTVCIIGAMVPISPAIDCMRGATAREICRSRHFGGSSSPASRRHVPKRPGLSCRQRRHSTKRRSCRFRPRSIACRRRPPAKFEEAAILAGLPHLPRDAMFRSVEGYPSGGNASQRSADRAAFARDRLHASGDRPRNLKKPPFWRVFLTCLATPCSEASRAILQAKRQSTKRRSCCSRARSSASGRRPPAKFEEAAVLAGFPHLPRDACSEASGAILQAETPANEAPIVLFSPAIDCL
jgi:hypothetical protein